MASITRPLNLRANITVADTRFDWVAALNVVLVGVLLFFLGSRYIYAPGMLVDVSGAPALPKTLALPVSSAPMPGVAPAAAITVLTVQQDGVFLYNGSIHSFNTLARTLGQTKGEDRGVLLIKAARDVSMQAFVGVCELARNAGFSSVQVAVESKTEGSDFRDKDGKPFLNALPQGG